jgi:putative two-component system response regulator
MGLASVDIQHLEIGGYLHDVGKIGIRDSVLLKAGRLDEKERLLVEEHPVIGLRILDPIELPEPVRAFVGGHHEKLDGSGYPDKLSQDQVSLYARVGAVADIYDALITDRPYRPALTLVEVIELLGREVKEGRLDGNVVQALRQIVDDWETQRRVDESLQGSSPLDVITAA